jgi:3-hydroxybutyryl-CoA dehydrogenase
MKKVIQEKARGIYNAKGLYEYSPEEAKAWEEAFALFNKDIYQLASQYPLSKKLELKDAD